MGPAPNELIKELDEPIRSTLGDQLVGDVRLLIPRKRVADDPAKFVVLDRNGRRIAVVHCSSPVSPGLVARAARMARVAQSLTGEKLGRRVLAPVFDGEVNGLSYMITQYCDPLSDGRLKWRMQRFHLRPKILEWLLEVARITVGDVDAEAVEQSFLEPLAQLGANTKMPARIRAAAERAIAQIEVGDWQPRHVLTHNDFWKGNVLIAPPHANASRSKWADRFVIIDWQGATEDGYAFVDLTKFAGSFAVPLRRFRLEVARHCQVVRCRLEDAVSYVLAGMGRLGMNLEHFPLERYVELTEAIYGKVACLSEQIPGE